MVLSTPKCGSYAIDRPTESFEVRKICYNCAVSLDGYIAGTGGEFDWITMDPEIDFQVISARFDTYLLGRRTFEVTGGQGLPASSGVRTFVFSRTLRQCDYSNVTIVGDNWKEVIQSLRKESGKDIWLFSGGSLFRSLAQEGLVDTVEVAIIPILLGGGVPLVAEPASRIALALTEHRIFERTGTVSLVYEVKASRH